MTISNEAVEVAALAVLNAGISGGGKFTNPDVLSDGERLIARAALEAAEPMIASELRTKLAKAERDIVLLQDTAKFHLSRIDVHIRVSLDMRVEREALRAKLAWIEAAAKPFVFIGENEETEICRLLSVSHEQFAELRTLLRAELKEE